MIPLTYSFCEDGVTDNIFLYNFFDSTINNNMLALTIIDDLVEEGAHIFLSERDTCLVSQQWIFEEVPTENEIKFIGIDIGSAIIRVEGV